MGVNLCGSRQRGGFQPASGSSSSACSPPSASPRPTCSLAARTRQSVRRRRFPPRTRRHRRHALSQRPLRRRRLRLLHRHPLRSRLRARRTRRLRHRCRLRRLRHPRRLSRRLRLHLLPHLRTRRRRLGKCLSRTRRPRDTAPWPPPRTCLASPTLKERLARLPCRWRRRNTRRRSQAASSSPLRSRSRCLAPP